MEQEQRGRNAWTDDEDALDRALTRIAWGALIAIGALWTALSLGWLG